MKVLLINAASMQVKQRAVIPLALLSLATYLTNNGHSVKIYDRAIEGGSVKKYLKSFSPDIVGISAPSGKSFDDAMKVSKVVKNNNVPVVWGGQLPTLIPEPVLISGFVDFIVMGEGEITLLALLKAIAEKTSFYEIEGLAFVDNGKPIVNKERGTADLSLFPTLDFSFVNPEKYFIRNMGCNRMVHIYSSKGCIGNCTYCYSPGFSKCEWRPRPPENCISEIKYLYDKFNIDGVIFVDDLLSPSKAHIIDLCDKLIESGIKILWNCDMRTDVCTKEVLQKMYDAGCRWILFGVESGSEERQKSIKKKLNFNRTKEVFDYCREIGIVSSTTFIVGYPDETEEELKETVKFMQNLNSDVKIPCFYGPIPKSELYDYLIKSKKLDVPQSYKDLEKFKFLDRLGENFSKVSRLELKVVVFYFFLMIFTPKYSYNNEKSRFWAKRVIRQTLDILKQGNLKAIYMFIIAGLQFLEIIFFAVMFPRIRKKYGLYGNKKDSGQN